MEIFSVLAKADKIKKIKAYERKLYMDNISRKKCVQINITLPPPFTQLSFRRNEAKKIEEKKKDEKLVQQQKKLASASLLSQAVLDYYQR